MFNLEKAIRSAKVLQQGQERTCTVPLTEWSESLDSSCNFPDNSGTKSSNRVEMLQNLQSTDFIHDHISQNVCSKNQLGGWCLKMVESHEQTLYCWEGFYKSSKQQWHVKCTHHKHQNSRSWAHTAWCHVIGNAVSLAHPSSIDPVSRPNHSLGFSVHTHPQPMAKSTLFSSKFSGSVASVNQCEPAWWNSLQKNSLRGNLHALLM
jgi:hypothetical protein